MFIASSTIKDRAPFGGAELKFMSTHLVTFRPSERRRREWWTPDYKHFTPTGWATWPHDSTPPRYDFKNLVLERRGYALVLQGAIQTLNTLAR